MDMEQLYSYVPRELVTFVCAKGSCSAHHDGLEFDSFPIG